MNENQQPVITEPNGHGIGRNEISDEQYSIWLNDMAPFLKQGSSLWYAMEKVGILKHKDSIYEKYRLNDWFSEKVDKYRAYVGELVNMVGYKTIERIHNRMIESDGKISFLGSEEVQVWKTMAEKHRSAQPFFVTRVEASQSDDKNIGKILDVIESETDDYEQIARQAQKQMVALDAPVQNQEQAGPTSDVSPEHPPTDAPSGEGQPQV